MEGTLEAIGNYGDTVLNNLEDELKKDKNTLGNKVKELSNDFDDIVEKYTTEGFGSAAITTLDKTLENLLRYGLTWRYGTSVVDIKNAFQENGLSGGFDQIITEGVQQLVYMNEDITSAVSTALKIRDAFVNGGTKKGIKTAFKEGLGEILDNSLVSDLYKNAVDGLSKAYESVNEWWLDVTNKKLEDMSPYQMTLYWNNMYKTGNLEEMEKTSKLLQEELPNIKKQDDKNIVIEVLMNQKLMEAKLDWWTARLSNDEKGMNTAESQGRLCRQAGATITLEEVTFVDVAYRQILNSIKATYGEELNVVKEEIIGESIAENVINQTQELIQVQDNNSLSNVAQLQDMYISENTISINNQTNFDTYISEHFKLGDFLSNETKDLVKNGEVLEIKLSSDLVDKMEELHLAVKNYLNAENIDMAINSGYRTEQDNERANGAHQSNHMAGAAADVTIWYENNGLTEFVSPSVVANLAEQVGFTGIGTYSGFNHLDLRTKKYKWTIS